MSALLPETWHINYSCIYHQGSFSSQCSSISLDGYILQWWGCEEVSKWQKFIKTMSSQTWFWSDGLATVFCYQPWIKSTWWNCGNCQAVFSKFQAE